jgi:glycosyltransferase involved in cell wall biosynthesis
VARFKPVSRHRQNELRRAFGLPPDLPLLISVGRNSFQKNYQPLYAALNELLSAPDAGWIFAHAGDGATALKSTLAPPAQARTFAFPRIEKIEEFYQAADAFVLISRYEGLSLSVLQALASGLRVFLTAVPGNNCLKRHFPAIHWLKLPPPTTAGITMIQASLRDWTTRAGAAATDQSRLVRQYFNQEMQLEKLYDFYQQVLKNVETRRHP